MWVGEGSEECDEDGFTSDLSLPKSLKIACESHFSKLDCISSFGKLSN